MNKFYNSLLPKDNVVQCPACKQYTATCPIINFYVCSNSFCSNASLTASKSKKILNIEENAQYDVLPNGSKTLSYKRHGIKFIIVYKDKKDLLDSVIETTSTTWKFKQKALNYKAIAKLYKKGFLMGGMPLSTIDTKSDVVNQTDIDQEMHIEFLYKNVKQKVNEITVDHEIKSIYFNHEEVP